jgi:ABC-type nitrate/sulfonate/bicarbonate transport system permease component
VSVPAAVDSGMRATSRRHVVSDRMLPWLALLVLFAFWQLLSSTGVLAERFFPTPTTVFGELVELVGTSAFWTSVGQTMQGWALGLGIAAGIAIPLGVVMGSNVWMYRASKALVEFLRPIPSVALIPLAVLIYGVALESKVFLAAFASLWPLLIQTLYGMQDVDPVARDTARAFRLSRIRRFTRVTLPGATPYIATGIRISSTTSLVLVVIAEIVIGIPGLGQEISLAQAASQVGEMYALIVTTGLIGWGLNSATARLEARVLHWHPSRRVREERV